MLGAARAVVLGAAGVLPPVEPEIQLLGTWALHESSGMSFADGVGGNHASLVDPAGNATHVPRRPPIRAGGAGSLQLSDQYIEIAMVEAYRSAAISAVIYLQPRTRLRGTMHWQSNRPDLRGFETIWSMGSQDGALFLKRVGQALRGGIYQSGSIAWFGGSDADVATLEVDVSCRIVVTQGPDGARLYVDDAEVASLPSVTLGWAAIASPIRIGRWDGALRPPYTCLGGLVSDARVYSGQLLEAEVSLLPAAASALPYTKPAALAGLPTFVVENQAGADNHAKLQNAVDAASAAGGGWVTQANPTVPLTGIKEIKIKGNAHLWRLNLKGEATPSFWRRMIDFHDAASGGQLSGHGGNPHYLIGCTFNHNHRAAPMTNTDGYRALSTADPQYGRLWPGESSAGTSPDNSENIRWHMEQARIVSLQVTSTPRIQVIARFCAFDDCNSDAFSVNENSVLLAEDCYAYRVRRGMFVQNGGNSEITAVRCEAEGEYPVGQTGAGTGGLIETGMSDVEPFNFGVGSTGRQTDFKLLDCWCTSDWDVQPEGPNSGTGGVIDMRNVHMVKSSFVAFTPVGSHGKAVKSWLTRGSTLRYSRESTPAEMSVLRGARVSDGVILIEDMLFIACGNFLHFHGQYRNFNTGHTFAFWHDPQWQGSVGPLTRIVYRRCRWETENLPAGISSGNVYCIRTTSLGSSPGEDVEFDDCTLSNAFAQSRPFHWAGQRILLSNGGVVRDDGRANADLFQGSYTLG